MHIHSVEDQIRIACSVFGLHPFGNGFLLHSFCPPSLFTSLKADRGLRAFTHVPEREHRLLLVKQHKHVDPSRDVVLCIRQ